MSYSSYSLPALPSHRVYDTYPSAETAEEDSLIVPKSWFLTDVKLFPSRVLGKGSYGTVCLGEWLGTSVAIKKLHEIFFHSLGSETEKRKVLKTFAREVGLSLQLKHPNIVSFYGVYDTSCHGDLSMISDTCLVQELLCMSLNARNRQKPNLTYRNIIDLSLGITSGLRYLHERLEPIIHCDLASKNVMLSLTGIPKISDLGVANIIKSTRIDSTSQSVIDVYMAPEIKLSGSQYNYTTDIYSLGVIILELSIGRDPTATEPFRVTTSNELQIIPESERRYSDLQDISTSPFYHLILGCLTRRDDRPDALIVYEKLKELQSQSSYTNQPDVPIIDNSADSSNNGITSKELEEKIQLLQAENETYHHQLVEHKQIEGDIRRLEATIRSRDSEISALRSKNISLEEELDQCKRGGDEHGSPSKPSMRLTSRGLTDSDNESELKQLKRQLEKYKDITVELDSKLKDARLELSKYSNRQTSNDIHAQYELNALRAENRMLRSDLERSRRDVIHYHSMYNRSYNSSRY